MRTLSRHIAASLLLLSAAASQAAPELIYDGSSQDPVIVTPEANTGLDAIYVFPSLEGVRLAVVYDDKAPVWSRFSNLGGGFAEELTSSVTSEDGLSILENVEPDMGYIVDFGTFRAFYYVIDYSRHQLDLQALKIADEQDCSSTLLTTEGTGPAIHFFTINGQQRTLSRELQLGWYTLEWDETDSAFKQVEGHKTLDYLLDEVTITPPAYCNTSFTLSGDRFLKAWNREQSASTTAFSPNALEVHTEAEQLNADKGDDDVKSNVVTTGNSGLGGSAPAEIEFRAVGTDALIHNEWQFARDRDFEYITNRITSPEITYTFREEGTIYVRFVGSNADGSCEAFGETYEVNIGSSLLKCPNAFSPGASEGTNDEWKVAYRSLTEFKCWIFDRYGTQMCYFDNPDLGWDGRYRGKLVKPGVYYYVIQAVGADGKHYKQSGDINIIRYKSTRSSSASNE